MEYVRTYMKGKDGVIFHHSSPWHCECLGKIISSSTARIVQWGESGGRPGVERSGEGFHSANYRRPPRTELIQKKILRPR